MAHRIPSYGRNHVPGPQPTARRPLTGVETGNSRIACRFRSPLAERPFVRHRSRTCRRRPLVAVVAKTQDEEANATEQEEQKKSEHRALPKRLGDVDGNDNRDSEIDQRDKVEKQPPSRTA